MNITKPEICPTCKGTKVAKVWWGRAGVSMEKRIIICHDCQGTGKWSPYYEGKYKLAIVDALNVLGAATVCSEVNCEGCAYERSEAMSILYSSLGLYLDFKNPVESYQEFCKIRDMEWANNERGLEEQS